MPLKSERLLPLIILMVAFYFALKALLFGLFPVGLSMESHFTEERVNPNTWKYKCDLTYREFLEGLSTRRKVLNEFISILKRSSFDTYFFETPPATETSLNIPFEFILTNSMELKGVTEDREAFREHFNNCRETVTSFPNLGGDALMVVPCPSSDDTTYSSLGAFMRTASDDQINAFWSRVGSEALQHWSRRKEEKVWMSTSGLGVYWLHLRLDSRPKYYTHDPYKFA